MRAWKRAVEEAAGMLKTSEGGERAAARAELLAKEGQLARATEALAELLEAWQARAAQALAVTTRRRGEKSGVGR